MLRFSWCDDISCEAGAQPDGVYSEAPKRRCGEQIDEPSRSLAGLRHPHVPSAWFERKPPFHESRQIEHAFQGTPEPALGKHSFLEFGF
jgi:hypothetical protein